MKIAIDIDDVIAETNASMVAWHNDKYGTTIQKEDLVTQDFAEVFEQDIEETIKRVREWRHSEYFDNIQPILGAFEVLQRISQHHDLVLVTGRFPDVEEKTLVWVKTYFPDVFQAIFFSKNHHIDNLQQRTKLEICRAEDADLLIDDVPEYLQDCLPHHPGLLFDQPWNRDVELLKGVTRVHSWEEIEKFLREK